jgi:hypothetical protein
MLSTDDLRRIHAQLTADIRESQRELDVVANMLRRRGIDPEAGRMATTSRRKTSKSRKPSRPGGYVKGGTAAAIMEVLADDQVWRNQDVAAQIGVTPTACSAAMRRLVSRGKVVEAGGYGRYKRAPSPNRHVEDKAAVEPTGLFRPDSGGEGVASVGTDATPGA